MEDQNTSFAKPRQVVEKIVALIEEEGPLVTLRGHLKTFDPFIMFAEFAVLSPAGFPYHPHRGFEAVTYMLEGAFCIQDRDGHKGVINEGDVQWMTAGRGTVHTETSAGDGENIGVQLWINLPSKDRMIKPAYKEIESKDISQVESAGVVVRVIAGEAFGVRSPAYCQTPTMFLDFTLKPGARVDQRIPEPWNAYVYVVAGEGVFGEPDAPSAARHHVLLLGGGEGVSVWNRSAEEPLRFLLFSGQPLEEPVVHKGPFVMSSQKEIEESFEDYRNCRNGFEKPEQV
ncbi:hypothetical protein Cni_G06159 [Canna indica]|uniref:Pirin n=1 Tax=Canna indica TaxID=4628 RepID=A0AAQ3JZG1_9LILI|nr:hypothetical protein Cni_G06159 [Canna indica]